MASWGGRDHGDGSWAEPAYYGSEKFVFVEDNCFNNTNGHAGGWIDGYRGGRYVYRYNHAYDSAPTNHGTEIGLGAASGAWKFITMIFIGTAIIHP